MQIKESDKLLRLQNILENSSQLHKLLQQVSLLQIQLTNSQHSSTNSLHELISLMQQLKVNQLNDILRLLHSLQTIIALPISIHPKFTLLFIVVPQGKLFDWHNHPNMLGISKCLHGTFRIVSLDIKELKCTENGGYVYRKSLERVEMLSYDGPLTTSVIFPDSFNIHRIEAMELSAFFDLLIPDYPEDQCYFFKTSKEDEEWLELKQIPEGTEDIIGLDAAIDQALLTEKHIVKNVVLI